MYCSVETSEDEEQSKFIYFRQTIFLQQLSPVAGTPSSDAMLDALMQADHMLHRHAE